MKAQNPTNCQILQAGLKALLRDLGPDGMLRFLQQLGSGSGDYTHDRCKLLPNIDVDSLFAAIKADRKLRTKRGPATDI